MGVCSWDVVLEPAIALADEGFAASAILAFASHLVTDISGASQPFPGGPLQPNGFVRLPNFARTLRALASGGRDGFYGGEFGRALLELGRGEYTADDLASPLAQWTEPLVLRAFGHDLWTVPPPSQGYLTLASAWIAERVGIPADPADPLWPHLIAEASRAAGFDRPERPLRGRRWAGTAVRPNGSVRELESIDPERGRAMAGHDGHRRWSGPSVSTDGDTTHLCAVDADGLAISLTQSNALDFGAHLMAGETGVFLHNRGVGFNLQPGHGAEYGPRRRPDAHTVAGSRDPPRRVSGPGHRNDGWRRPAPDSPPAARPPAARRPGPGHRHFGRPGRARGTWRSAVPALAGADAIVAHGVRRPAHVAAGARIPWSFGAGVGALNPVDVGLLTDHLRRNVDGHLSLTVRSDPRSARRSALGRCDPGAESTPSLVALCQERSDLPSDQRDVLEILHVQDLQIGRLGAARSPLPMRSATSPGEPQAPNRLRSSTDQPMAWARRATTVSSSPQQTINAELCVGSMPGRARSSRRPRRPGRTAWPHRRRGGRVR